MLPSYMTLTLNEETGECVSWDLRIDKYNGVTYISIMANSKAPCFTLIEQALSVFFNVNYI